MMVEYCNIKPEKLTFKFGVRIDAEQLLSDLLTEEINKAWGISTSHRYRYREINRKYFGEVNLKLETVKVESKVVKLRVRG